MIDYLERLLEEQQAEEDTEGMDWLELGREDPAWQAQTAEEAGVEMTEAGWTDGDGVEDAVETENGESLPDQWQRLTGRTGTAEEAAGRYMEADFGGIGKAVVPTETVTSAAATETQERLVEEMTPAEVPVSMTGWAAVQQRERRLTGMDAGLTEMAGSIGGAARLYRKVRRSQAQAGYVRHVTAEMPLAAPVTGTETRGLSPEGLDRIFQRDARRYDGGFTLF